MRQSNNLASSEVKEKLSGCIASTLQRMSLIDQLRAGLPLKSSAFLKRITASSAGEVDTENGNTVLHYACCGAAPLSVVASLLKANPVAASAKDSDGNIPLSGAVANGAGADVVQALLAAFPDGISVRQAGGRQHTLLHSACCNRASEATVTALLAAWPKAACERDTDGNTPLHFAASRKAGAGVVRALLAACPEAAALRGQMGRLPLSLAVLCEAPPLSCEAIRDAHPSALRELCVVADYLNHGYGVIGDETSPSGPGASARKQC